MAATVVVDRPLDGVPADRSSLWWSAAAAGVAIAGLGAATDLKLLLGLGVLIAGAAVIMVAPEVFYALFLSAGIIKVNPLLAAVPGDLTLLTAAAVSVALVLSLVRDGVPPLPTPAAIYPLLAALGLLSVFWTDLPEVGLEKAVIFESLTALSFISAFILVRTRTQLMRFMMAIVAIALLVALTAEETGHQAHAFVAAGSGTNEIELALMSGFGLMAAFGYLFVVDRHAWGVLWIVPATIFATTILKAGSRGVLIGTVLGLVFLLVWLGVAGGRGRRLLLVVLVGGAVAAVVGGPQLTGGATTKYKTELFSSNPADVLRQRNWYFTQGWELTAAHPFGTGLAGYEAATGERYPHNIVLEYGSELGIPGVALFLALFIAAWRSLTSGAARYTPEAAVVGALLVLFATESLVSLGPNESRPLWFTIGLALSLPHFRTDQ